MSKPPEHTPTPWQVYDRGIGWEIHDTAMPHGPINTEFRDTFTAPDAAFIVRACNEYDALRSSHAALMEALKNIWSMFDDGRIVRNITNDHKPDWALKMLTFAQELNKISAAIAAAEEIQKCLTS